MKPRTALILLGITAVGAWLRLQSLGAKSLWYNEADSSCFLELAASDLMARSFETRAVHPPLYHLALQAWDWAWGGADGSLRSLAAICGVATILGVYFVARELSLQSDDDEVTPGGIPFIACIAASLVAISPLQVQLSRQVRGYSMAAMLLAWSGWALLRATRNDGRPASRWLLPSACFLALLACYTHHMATLTVAAQVIYAAARFRKIYRDDPDGASRSRGSIIFAASLLAAGYLVIGLPTLLAQSQTIRRDYSDPVGWRQALGEVAATLSATALSDPRDGGFGAVVVAILAIAGVCWLLRSGRRGWQAGFYLALTGLTPLLVQVAFSAASDRSIIKARYLSFAQLSWLIGVAFSIRIARGRVARAIFAGWTLATFAYFCHSSWPILGPTAAPGMRAAVATALGGRSPGELIISADPTSFCGVRHYTRGKAKALLLVEDGSRIAQRGSEHLLEGQLATVEELEASRPTGLWVFSSIANQFGRDDLLGRMAGLEPAGRWIFNQDYFSEPPLILAHYRIDPARRSGTGSGSPADRPETDRVAHDPEEVPR